MYHTYFCKGSEQGACSQDQTLSAQQAAVINLTGVGNFMQPQATGMFAELSSVDILSMWFDKFHTEMKFGV